MIDHKPSPSELPDDLVQRLVRWQLCEPSDFRRARACVRRLSRELPAFDSVWIDALVQLRKLTPYQARLLEKGQGDQLRIADFVIMDEIGRGPHGTTLSARNLSESGRVVLKRILLAPESQSACRQRLTQLIERSQGWTHPNIVIPERLLPGEGAPVIVSSWIPGLTLAELLVRRGRFPADVVVEIARQLANALAALHARGLVHGDLRLSNVRLTPGGHAVLVDGGVLPATHPELTIHDKLALESYDGIAPELIGTGTASNASSEIYSLGCLLYQLLTGRPPYSMADPLIKLAAHQTQRIADVRDLAPDTPVEFARQIQAMTSADINLRPQSMEELLRLWKRPGWNSRRRLKEFRQRFEGAIPHFSESDSSGLDSRWAWIAVCLFLASGMALTFADKGLRSDLLAVTQRIASAIQSHPSTVATSPATSEDGGQNTRTNAEGGLLPLPAPSAEGEIVLTEAGPYDVASVAVRNHLTIRGAEGIHPVIQIDRDSLKLSGATIALRNLIIRCDIPGVQSRRAMVLAKSQSLTIDSCAFLQRDDDVDGEQTSIVAGAAGKKGSTSTAVGWGPLSVDESDGGPPRVDVQNCVFRSGSTALWFAELPMHLNLTNSLKLGTGAFISAASGASAHDCSMTLERVTLREGGPLLRLAGTYAEKAETPAIEITSRNCVFTAGRRDSNLFELYSDRPRIDAAQSVRLTGHGSVISPDLNLLATIDSGESGSTTGTVTPVDDSDGQFEGIVVSEFTFAGPASVSISNSHLESLTAPRSSSDRQPGVDVSRLPVVRIR